MALLLVLAGCAGFSKGEKMEDAVKVYPVPNEENLSDDFVMTVNGQNVPLQQARVSAYPINGGYWKSFRNGKYRELYQTELASFASFGVSGAVKVELKPNRTFRNVVIRPLSKKVVPQVAGGKISFTLPEAGQYVVELDGRHKALHIFADPVKDYKVDKNDPNVIYFGPGCHNAGHIQVKSNQTVFLDDGAIVYGHISAFKANNIRFLGHGILNGSKIREQKTDTIGKPVPPSVEHREHAIMLYNCEGVTVDGIIIKDSCMYNLNLGNCNHVDINNVKIVGQWTFNTDGIDLHNCRYARIHNCFVRTFDDCICVKGHGYFHTQKKLGRMVVGNPIVSDILVEKCVLWCDWNTTLEIGAETFADEIYNITFRDCDIIKNQAAACDISAWHHAVIHDVLYENIRIEQTPTQQNISQKKENQPFEENLDPAKQEPYWCIRTSTVNPKTLLENMKTGKYPSYDKDDFTLHPYEKLAKQGVFKNIVFRNISVTGTSMMRVALGGGPGSGPITIENLTFNGKKIKSFDELFETYIGPNLKGSVILK